MNILTLILIWHHLCFIFCFVFQQLFYYLYGHSQLTLLKLSGVGDLNTWNWFWKWMGKHIPPYSFHILFVKILPTPNFVLVALLNLCVLRVSFVDKTERAQQGNLLVWFRQVPTFSWLVRMTTAWKTLFFQPAAWRRASSTLSLDVQRIPWELSLLSTST